MSAAGENNGYKYQSAGALWTRPVGVRVQKVQRGHRVQRGWWAPLWTRPAGVRVEKVQKVQKVQRVKVGGCAASFYKTFTTALAGEGKQANRPVGDKMHPFWC